MGKGKRGKGGGSDKSGKTGEPKVVFEDFADADRLFREVVGEEPAADEDAFPPRELRVPPPPKLPPVERPQRTFYARPASQRGERRSLDLHRLTLAEAKARVDAEVADILATTRGLTRLKIITGKGLHSGPGGAVLPREIHTYVEQRYATHIVSLDESPADVTLGGVPLRGYFVVTFRS